MMLLKADARAIPLRDGCVQSVVTSPPYFGLRDYGVHGQIGLEASPLEYIASICDVFAEVRRVLRDDGTVWLNLGDSYANGGGIGAGGNLGRINRSYQQRNHRSGVPGGLKSKDLVGIPWRVAFALQADGWYLRSDIIWSKPNPMPESVTDRPTKAHEYLFLLTKSERYYYDADAIREPYALSTVQELRQAYDGLGIKDYDSAGVQNPSDVKRRIIERARQSARERGGVRSNDLQSYGLTRGSSNPSVTHENGANKRSVWHIPTQPYPDSHFATFPEALVEPCILAGSRPGDLVLDPFIGSGTTGVVADRLMRRWVGLDLNYQHLAMKRTAQRGLRLLEAGA